MDTFIKLPDNLTVIPEVFYFYQNPAFHVLANLISYGYHKDSPAFGNTNHTKTVILAAKHKEGKFVSLFSHKALSDATGLSPSSIIRGIKTLEKLGLVKAEKLGQEGTLFYLGTVDKTNNNSVKTYLMSLGEKADTLEGAKQVQTVLIKVLGIKSSAKPIHSIKFKKETKNEEDVEDKRLKREELVSQEEEKIGTPDAKEKIIKFFANNRINVPERNLHMIINPRGPSYAINVANNLPTTILTTSEIIEIECWTLDWMNKLANNQDTVV